MCGIAGISSIDGSRVEEQQDQKVLESIRHRGPDGSGVWWNENQNVRLYHTRLSILDLDKRSAQPMISKNERFIITFNGEVFNFLELRSELVTLGHEFHTESDTEVVLAAFEEWGDRCFERFNGMWALAIYDKENQNLTLSRDRFGIKPLYYALTSNAIYFASETNAFRSFSGLSVNVSQDLLMSEFRTPYSLEGYGLSIYDEVKSILPGTIINLNQSTKKIQKKRWYNLIESTEENQNTWSDQIEEFAFLFRDAVNLRLRSDVPIATALSGGLDSSSVYAMIDLLLSEDKEIVRSPEKLNKAFVAIFPGSKDNEKEFAKSMVESVGTEVRFLDMNSGDITEERVLDILQKADFLNSNPIDPLVSVYSEMRNDGYMVSMDGHGVDEMLYGYRYDLYDLFAKTKSTNSKELNRLLIDTVSGMYHPEDRARISSRLESEILSFSPLDGLKRVLKKVLGKRKVATQKNGLNYDFSNMTQMERGILYESFLVKSLPSLLRNFDKASMLSSVEIRMPFMDYRLVEFCFSLPVESKIRGARTKAILREAMKGLLPEPIRDRSFKVGFSSPIADWMNTSLNKMVLSKESQILNFLNLNDIQHNSVTLKASIRNKSISTSEAVLLWKSLSAMELLSFNN